MNFEDEEEEVETSPLPQVYTPRGDGFDIGEAMPANINNQDPDIINIIRNPQALAESFNLTEKQAANLRSLIIGGGTGSIHRLLSEHFGDDVSAVLGALASSWVSKKIIRR
jgi:hypothetical protein